MPFRFWESGKRHTSAVAQLPVSSDEDVLYMGTALFAYIACTP